MQFSRDPQAEISLGRKVRLRFLEKEIPTSKFSKERGFQCKGLHQLHKHAKRNAAAEESEEKGKYCQWLAEHRSGEIRP